MFCTFGHRIIKPLNVHADMFRHILYYVTSVFLLLHPSACYSTDYKSDKETEKRIGILLGKMTLEEKIGQMNQLHCENFPYLKAETRKGRDVIHGKPHRLSETGKPLVTVVMAERPLPIRIWLILYNICI